MVQVLLPGLSCFRKGVSLRRAIKRAKATPPSLISCYERGILLFHNVDKQHFLFLRLSYFCTVHVLLQGLNDFLEGASFPRTIKRVKATLSSLICSYERRNIILLQRGLTETFALSYFCSKARRFGMQNRSQRFKFHFGASLISQRGCYSRRQLRGWMQPCRH